MTNRGSRKYDFIRIDLRRSDWLLLVWKSSSLSSLICGGERVQISFLCGGATWVRSSFRCLAWWHFSVYCIASIWACGFIGRMFVSIVWMFFVSNLVAPGGCAHKCFLWTLEIKSQLVSQRSELLVNGCVISLSLPQVIPVTSSAHYIVLRLHLIPYILGVLIECNHRIECHSYRILGFLHISTLVDTDWVSCTCCGYTWTCCNYSAVVGIWD